MKLGVKQTISPANLIRPSFCKYGSEAVIAFNYDTDDVIIAYYI